jgi:general secretion pathway protein G
LIELLVVLAIVASLLTLAVPRYLRGLDKANETVLVENLRLTRDVIDKFYADTGVYPDSLEQLVERRYLKALPVDPITESTSSWTLVPPPAGQRGKVFDLRSAAPGETLAGTPFTAL